jgi:cytochrome P450
VLTETLRLFPLVGTAKWTDQSTTTLVVHGGRKTIVLPPQTMVISNQGDLHVNPKDYGPDPLAWRPGRWSAPDGVAGDEKLIPPTRGTFLA